MKVLREQCDFGAEHAGRVDRVVQRLTGLSRAGVRGLFDHGCVSVNNSQFTDSAAHVQRGDVVQVRFDPNRRYNELRREKSDPAYQILFEDEYLIVVNKAAHVLTVPSGKSAGSGKSLIERLQRHVHQGKPQRVHRPLFVVHRLDQGVSGVLVVAKRADVAAKIKDQFAAHKPKRTYIAIVHGRMESKRGTFRSHLVTDYDLNRRSTKKPGKGELAITHYEVVDARADFSIVRVQLETGRRNQIRVHFAEAGHPVLGDPRYRPDLSQHPRWKARRIALHAQSLEFAHPATRKTMRFEAPLPAEFDSLQSRLAPKRREMKDK